tara:strand:- start:726 stop:926 length:201 start_codon:yes stop_codon:yes gene_type:complete
MWAMGISPCKFCGEAFGYNPKRVPSLGGEPICQHCMAAGNRERVKQGLEAFPIHPEAYEPILEKEL